jgi:hypothetical protein
MHLRFSHWAQCRKSGPLPTYSCPQETIARLLWRQSYVRDHVKGPRVILLLYAQLGPTSCETTCLPAVSCQGGTQGTMSQ